MSGTGSGTGSDVRDVAELVASGAAEHPDRLAVVEAGGRSLTWAQLDDEVGRIATGLGVAGVLGGHRVLFAIGNRIEFVTTYLGVLRAQAVAVPVNPGSRPGELARMIADSGARLVVADADTTGALREAVASLETPPRLVVTGEQSYDDLRAEPARPVPQLQDPEKLAVLLYTSGTSGLPRAAMLTHRALLANVEQVARVEPQMMHGDDVVLCVLPLFHVYGLNAVLGGMLRHRAKLVLVERFDPHETLTLIDDEACSVVPVAPPVFAYWQEEEHLEEHLGPVRLILCGSAPLSAELVERFTARTGIPVHQGYGLTEAAPVVTSTLCSVVPQVGFGRRRAARASRSGWSTRPGTRPRATTPARSRSAATTCSAATGPTEPAARTTTAGGRPVTSASSTRRATCSSSTGSRSW